MYPAFWYWISLDLFEGARLQPCRKWQSICGALAPEGSHYFKLTHYRPFCRELLLLRLQLHCDRLLENILPEGLPMARLVRCCVLLTTIVGSGLIAQKTATPPQKAAAPVRLEQRWQERTRTADRIARRKPAHDDAQELVHGSLQSQQLLGGPRSADDE